MHKQYENKLVSRLNGPQLVDGIFRPILLYDSRRILILIVFFSMVQLVIM